MDGSGRKIDAEYFRTCCKIAASNTKGQGRLNFLRHLCAWLIDRAHEPPFRPSTTDNLENQYINAIIKVTEGAMFGEFDPRAELLECLKNLDSPQ